ncbi:MAG: hypothetical protein IJ087_21025 [Eggerthellaceae bacterium]|nr:hypothetical protein [Eggerthellaceae bacterium]
MTTKDLATYGDWVALLADAKRCDKEHFDLLRSATFEPGASARVFMLVQAYCTRCLNALSRSLENALRQIDPRDADSFQLLCMRYSEGCRRLMFFEEVEGFPDEGRLLAEEISSHVAQVLRTLRKDCERQDSSAASDMAYRLARLEREWVRG